MIGNQAVATFEVGGQTLSVTSNLVTTTINKISAVDLEAAQTKTAIAGGKVFFPHTITNNGNAPDIFNLTTPVVDAGLSVVAIYADADCNGTPDNLTAITQTASLDPGTSTCVVVELDVAGSLTATDAPTYQITATSTMTDDVEVAPTDTNVDTVDVVTGEVLGLVKRMSMLTDTGAAGFSPGDTIRVRSVSIWAPLSAGIRPARPSASIRLEAAPSSTPTAAGSRMWLCQPTRRRTSPCASICRRVQPAPRPIHLGTRR